MTARPPAGGGMRFFRLSRACREWSRAFPAHFDEMRADIAGLYAAHGATATARFDLECAFFLHWCMEIGLHNARAGAVDRWWALGRFDHGLSRLGRRLPPQAAVLAGDPMDSYRQRYREALSKIRNVYVRRPRNGGLEMPLTPRLSTLFVRYTAQTAGPIPDALTQEAHRRLTAICERHVTGFMIATG